MTSLGITQGGFIMADDGTTTAQPGQPVGTAAPATTQPGTTGGTGQPAATDQTTNASGTGSASGEEDTFFDPKDLDPSLVPAYKGMQKAFSKKMEAIKANRQKIDVYDQFSRDPLGQIQTMASRLGYKLTRAEAAAVANEGDPTGTGDKKWEPQTWDEVQNRFLSAAEQRLMEKFNPIIDELQTLKKGSMEKMLDENCPDWREHEDEMVTLLREHPTLAKDPVKLYRLSLPPEILETRATQAALKKLQSKVDGSRPGGTSTAKASASAGPTGPISFNEAVEIAKRQLAEKGLKAP